MASYYAICPFCKKSVFADDTSPEVRMCPLCGERFDFDYATTPGFLIDVDAANHEYKLGLEFFVNTDFREAQRYFVKTLAIYPNHYLAQYHVGMCTIYENEGKRHFDVTRSIVDNIKSCIDKLFLAHVRINDRISFLTLVINQSYIVLSKYFNKTIVELEKKFDWDSIRQFSLEMLNTLKEVFTLEKEQLMTYDAHIKQNLIGFADMAITACQKIVSPYIENQRLNLPTLFEYNAAKNYYTMFNFYAQIFDPEFVASIKTDYSPALLYNQASLEKKISQYYALNSSNEKKYLSTPCELLDEIISRCVFSINLAYNICFKGLTYKVEDAGRMELVSDTIDLCFEALMPRLSLAADKKIDIFLLNYEEVNEILDILDEFISEYAIVHRGKAIDRLERFFSTIALMLPTYFELTYKRYNKFVNRLKKSQNQEFRYYNNFLFMVTLSCYLATRVHDLTPNLSQTRLKLLQLGKQSAEEFLLLNDYNLNQLEDSKKYSKIIDIFNSIDSHLESEEKPKKRKAVTT